MSGYNYSWQGSKRKREANKDNRIKSDVQYKGSTYDYSNDIVNSLIKGRHNLYTPFFEVMH